MQREKLKNTEKSISSKNDKKDVNMYWNCINKTNTKIHIRGKIYITEKNMYSREKNVAGGGKIFLYRENITLPGRRIE